MHKDVSGSAVKKEWLTPTTLTFLPDAHLDGTAWKYIFIHLFLETSLKVMSLKFRHSVGSYKSASWFFSPSWWMIDNIHYENFPG